MTPICPQLAADGYTNTGQVTLARAGQVWTLATVAKTPYSTENSVKFSKLTALEKFKIDAGEYLTGAQKNTSVGSVCAITSTGEGTNKNTMFLVTANQYFTESTGVSISEAEADASAATYTTWVQMANGTYGQLWGFYHFLKNEAGSVKIGLQSPDRIIFVGALLGVGTAFSWTLSVNNTKYNTSGALLTELFTSTSGGVSSGNKAVIAAPANGVGQFKGLSTSTPVTKYN